MMTDVPIEQRDDVPDAIRYVRQEDGNWTVYQDGDELPPEIEQ